jgi:hypothetical protein
MEKMKRGHVVAVTRDVCMDSGLHHSMR